MSVLKGKVALVAGSARGAGRGIAISLAEAGAKVYCTARSGDGQIVKPLRPGSVEETAAEISRRGGEAIPLRVDHTKEDEVDRLFDRIENESGRLDVLVNNTNADTAYQFQPFWKLEPEGVRQVLDAAIYAHILNARRAARLMTNQKSGLIVEITDGDGFYYRGNLCYDLTKVNAIRLAMAMAIELKKKKVAAVAVTPGFLRSEAVLATLNVSEENWRDAIENRPEFAESETPFFVGRAIASLTADAAIMQKSGRVFSSIELARMYGFTDVDGRLPDVWTFFRENMPQFSFRKIDDQFLSYVRVDYDAIQAELEMEGS